MAIIKRAAEKDLKQLAILFDQYLIRVGVAQVYRYLRPAGESNGPPIFIDLLS